MGEGGGAWGGGRRSANEYQTISSEVEFSNRSVTSNIPNEVHSSDVHNFSDFNSDIVENCNVLSSVNNLCDDTLKVSEHTT